MPGLPKETWSIVKYPKNSTINIPKLLNEKLIRATGVGTCGRVQMHPLTFSVKLTLPIKKVKNPSMSIKTTPQKENVEIPKVSPARITYAYAYAYAISCIFLAYAYSHCICICIYAYMHVHICICICICISHNMNMHMHMHMQISHYAYAYAL